MDSIMDYKIGYSPEVAEHLIKRIRVRNVGSNVLKFRLRGD